MTAATLALWISLASPSLEAVQVEEHLGAQVPLDLAFADEDGRRVRLGDYFGDGKPVLVVLAYYHCPMLCGLVLRGVQEALANLSWSAGQEYRVLTISFDPRDGASQAKAKQAETVRALGRGAAAAWPFLTGDESSITSLARALGFGAVRDKETGEYAHPAVLFVLTPDGRVARYLYGIQFPVRDVKLALLEAGQGTVGSSLEKLLMRCYAYDPASRRYLPFVSGLLRLGGLAFFLALAVALLRLWRRERIGASP